MEVGGSDADPPLTFLTLKREGRAVQKGGSDPPKNPGKSHPAFISNKPNTYACRWTVVKVQQY